MTILNITDPNFFSILSGGYTLDDATTFLRQRFINAGWGNPIAINDAGAIKVTVFQLAYNPSATHGTVRAILETSLATTTLTVRLRLFSQLNYNTETFVGTNNTGANTTATGVNTGATFTVSTIQPLIAYTLPITQEITGVALVESPSTFRGILGLCYYTKEAWVNENTWVHTKLVQPTIPNSYWMAAPFANNTTTAVVGNVARSQLSTFGARNPINSQVQLVKAPFVTHLTFGIDGRFNEDFALCNNTGLTIGDINVVTAGVEEWWNLWCGDNGIALRCV